MTNDAPQKWYKVMPWRTIQHSLIMSDKTFDQLKEDHKMVERMGMLILPNGYIFARYEQNSAYEGVYCLHCQTFIKWPEMAGWRCPHCGKIVVYGE